MEAIGNICIDAYVIPVYRDPHMEDTNFLIMYKQKVLENPGIIFAPFLPALREEDSSVIESEEKKRAEEIIEIKRNPKPENIKAIICSVSDNEKINLIESMVINHINKHKQND